MDGPHPCVHKLVWGRAHSSEAMQGSDCLPQNGDHVLPALQQQGGPTSWRDYCRRQVINGAQEARGVGDR
jgi:hypothetical protein